MYTFDANYDEEGAARAERIFYVRSITELRRWSTFGPPLFLAAVLLGAHAVNLPAWFATALSAFLALSIIGPIFFYVARPIDAKRLARKFPVRRVALTPSTMEITAGGQTAVIAWDRVKHIWSAGDYLLLVLGKFVSVSIPRRSLPPGANEFILASVKHAT